MMSWNIFSIKTKPKEGEREGGRERGLRFNKNSFAVVKPQSVKRTFASAPVHAHEVNSLIFDAHIV